jgi:hypothetical protein
VNEGFASQIARQKSLRARFASITLGFQSLTWKEGGSSRDSGQLSFRTSTDENDEASGYDSMDAN